MINKLCKLVCVAMAFGLCGLTTLSVHAVDVGGLYTADAKVSDQSAQVRAEATKTLFRDVLVKVHGSAGDIEPLIAANSAHADQYLSEYGYVRHSTPDESNQLYFSAKFDAKAIDQLISSANLSIWGRNRPLTLFWIAVNQNPNAALATAATATPASDVASGQQPFILNANDTQKLRDAVMADAKVRALPALLPMGDLDDLQQVTVADVADLNRVNLQKASLRYHADAIVAVKLAALPDKQWQATWIVISDNNVSDGNDSQTITSGDLNAALTQVIAAATDKLSQVYAVPVAEQQSVSNELVNVRVINIHNMNEYAKVMKYLGDLKPVKNIEVVQLTPQQVIFQLQVSGGRVALTRALNLEHRLSLQADASDNQQVTDLTYQWLST